MVQNALRVVEQAVGERLKPVGKIVQFPPHKKGPAAVALGKLGGHEGAFFCMGGRGDHNFILLCWLPLPNISTATMIEAVTVGLSRHSSCP